MNDCSLKGYSVELWDIFATFCDVLLLYGVMVSAFDVCASVFLFGFYTRCRIVVVFTPVTVAVFVLLAFIDWRLLSSRRTWICERNRRIAAASTSCDTTHRPHRFQDEVPDGSAPPQPRVDYLANSIRPLSLCVIISNWGLLPLRLLPPSGWSATIFSELFILTFTITRPCSDCWHTWPEHLTYTIFWALFSSVCLMYKFIVLILLVR